MPVFKQAPASQSMGMLARLPLLSRAGVDDWQAERPYLFLSPIRALIFLFFPIFFFLASCQASAPGGESWARSGHGKAAAGAGS